MRTCFWGFVTLILATGCAHGPRFQEVNPAPHDKATVYVYRSKQIMGWGGLFPTSSPHCIWLNGVEPVMLHPGGYCVYYVLPGTNFFSSELYSPDWMLNAVFKRDDILRTDFEAAKTYYLKFVVGAVAPKLLVVDTETGTREIQDCKLEASNQ